MSVPANFMSDLQGSQNPLMQPSSGGQGATSGSSPLNWQQIQQLVTPPPLPSPSASPSGGDQTAPTPSSTPSSSAAPAPSKAASDDDDDTAAPPDQPGASQPGSPPLTAAQQASVVQDLLSSRSSDSALMQQYLQDLSESEQEEKQVDQAEISTLNEQPPSAPQQQTTTPLQRLAPLLLLSAFGGKATKMNAGLMLAATSGTVQGYLQGNAQQVATGQKQYEEAYKEFKDRQDQQVKIFDEMRKAYADRPDADLKALQMSRQLTGDEGKVDQQLLEIQQHYQTAASQLAENQKKLTDEDYFKRANLQLQQKKTADAEKKAAGGGEGADPAKVSEIRAAMADIGAQFPQGMRSAAAQNSMIEGELAKHPDWTAQQIAQNLRSVQVGTRAADTETTQVARREANITPAVTALTEPGGLFDQLDEAARKIDFGASKTVNQLRLAAQGHAVADPDIQRYVTLIQDVQTDVTSVLSRTGQATDAVRRQAMDAFPLNSSYEELKTEMDASRKVARALQAGNESVIAALTKGVPIRQAAATDTGSGNRGTVTSDTLSQYAKQHSMTVDQAKQFLSSQGYQVP